MATRVASPLPILTCAVSRRSVTIRAGRRTTGTTHTLDRRQPMLELSAISTSYGTVPMLRDVSLTVAKGELVCLLGPNGAGKSTTFNTICGLVAPDRGRVRIMGQDVEATGTERLGALGVGFVPEGLRLFPSLTGRQNLRLGYDASRCTEPFEERLAAMGKLFPRIGERLGQGAGTLSGGEQAMVALARALTGDPASIVMDDPPRGPPPTRTGSDLPPLPAT